MSASITDRSKTINNFDNKTVFITGGAAGIGLGMARAFAERGANLALADIDQVQLDKARSLFKADGIEVQTYSLDICDRDAVKQAVNSVATHFGGINIVCANAGVAGYMGPLQKGSDSDWDWIIDVNIRGTINTVQACLPHLVKHPQQAHIVLTSSVSGLRIHKPSRGQGMYNMTKFAMVGYGEALSLDLEPDGVGVSILCPGIVNTDITNSGRNRPDRFGGPVVNSSSHELASAALSGTDPLIFGRWVIKAIEAKRLIVITHDNDRAMVEARQQNVLDSFDYCSTLTR